ncbi:hypothetical protein E3N88_22535 [Mikania micrantha]|uniref:Uncharacterized protein n=1 Tax=Mikania micrantha TaxID=192012 RepID=A0A5N6NAZ6_9ASTR|nr:hypothetical protein E3N88_22535 [Mikania micrantha]
MMYSSFSLQHSGYLPLCPRNPNHYHIGTPCRSVAIVLCSDEDASAAKRHEALEAAAGSLQEVKAWRFQEAGGGGAPLSSSMAGTGRVDEAGPSRKDKGKHALYDEDEIEEDLGLTDVEEDDRVPGYDD